LAKIVDSCRVSEALPGHHRFISFRFLTPHDVRLPGPDGDVARGSRRKYTDNVAVSHLKRMLLAGKECQASLINYRKGGTPL
jgi:hypothetical protein